MFTRKDAELRLALYRQTVRIGRIPKVAEFSRAGIARLAKHHILGQQPGSSEILRLAPFWAVPTRFPVQIGKRALWASCAWDALGIPAMLRRDARIETGCACCESAMTVEVRDGRVVTRRGVIHIALPAGRWYENVVYT
jgi:hypothetical protein